MVKRTRVETLEPEVKKTVVNQASETIQCWQCGALVPLGGLGRIGAAATCPSCGEILDEKGYDEAAAKALEDLSSTVAELEEASKEVARLDKRLARWGFLAKLPFLPARGRLAAARAREASLRCSRASLEARLHGLAVGRYYASEWYRVTKAALRSPRGDSAFGNPRYVKQDNHLAFECLDDAGSKKRARWARARYAEYRVFEEVRRIASTGALGHCRILGGLYVPYDTDSHQKYKKEVRYNEIDLLLITRGAVVVVEVKRSVRDVDVRFDRWNDRYTAERSNVGEDGLEQGVPEKDWAPEQNSAHCRTVANAGVYSVDADSVVSLVAYASSPKVALRADQGLGGCPAFFASLDGEGPRLEGVLKEAVECVPPSRSDYEVDIVADEFYARFHDADGSRARAHRERIERERRLRSMSRCA